MRTEPSTRPAIRLAFVLAWIYDTMITDVMWNDKAFLGHWKGKTPFECDLFHIQYDT